MNFYSEMYLMVLRDRISVMSSKCAMSMRKTNVQSVLQDTTVVVAVQQIRTSSTVPLQMPMILDAKCNENVLNVPS